MAGRSTKRSRADELADLFNPAPRDYDPETVEAGGGSSESGDESGRSDLADQHYLDVGPSDLRKAAEDRELQATLDQELGEAGTGQRVSRKDLEESSDSDQSAPSLTSSDSEKSQNGSQDPSDQSDSEPDDGDSLRRQIEQTIEQDRAKAEAASNDQVDDIERGRQVTNQLKLYDRFLDTRIRFQKALTAANSLQVENPDSTQNDPESSARGQAEDAALALFDDLGDFRDMLASGANEPVASNSMERKRKRGDRNRSLDDLWQDVRLQNQNSRSWVNSALSKWSARINAASGFLQSNKFKAVAPRDPIVQIRELLTAERARLIERTHQRKEALENGSRSVFDPNIFDDGDFYSTLLRDLIDSRMADSGNQPQSDLARWQAGKQEKKHRENVDVKASKGRKLRYQFMAPIPAGTWDDAQIDELYSSLFGRFLSTFTNTAEAQGEPVNEPDNAPDPLPKDDFRIFG